MNLLGSAFSIYAKVVDRWLRRASADPAGYQQRTFERLLDRAKDTWFGRKHGFASITTHADFVNAVPLGDYVSQMDLFDRMLAGEPDVSWPGVVRYFAQTSGTTAGDKRIPVTADMARSNRRAAMAIFAYYSRRGQNFVGELAGGQMLFLGGSTAMTPTGAGGWIGDLSGIASQSIRWPITRLYEPGHELALIDNWEEKIETVAHRVARRDIRFVTGMPSWVKILFDRVCELRDVSTEDGISRIWPNFRLFVHGGVNFEPFRPTFAHFFAPDHDLQFLEVYPASEGFLGIQAEADNRSMELLVDNGLFYEFVPLSEWGKPDAPRLTFEEVETGVPYSVLLSTNAGLWAYDIGDVVTFTSLTPPRILFAGRNKHFINAFGENIIGQQVSQAVAVAAEATGAEVDEFTASPRYAGNEYRTGAHQYVVEFHREPPAGMDAFARAIDAALQSINVDYFVKRKGDLGMTCVEVTAVPEGTFYRWMKQRGKLGGQNKVPVCANDRRYVDDLLKLDSDIAVQ
ncbi:MAG: GH3 auxin-responsive promoter family protein [Planctomycetota bacterium]|jgi:hypothetical protein